MRTPIYAYDANTTFFYWQNRPKINPSLPMRKTDVKIFYMAWAVKINFLSQNDREPNQITGNIVWSNSGAKNQRGRFLRTLWSTRWLHWLYGVRGASEQIQQCAQHKSLSQWHTKHAVFYKKKTHITKGAQLLLCVQKIGSILSQKPHEPKRGVCT